MLLAAVLSACTPTQLFPGNPAQAGAPLASAQHRPERPQKRKPPPPPSRTELPSRPLPRAPAASLQTPAVPAAIGAPPEKADAPIRQPDWTALFKAWENGCTNSPEFDVFEKHFVFFDKQRGLQVGEVRLPGAFKAATGTPVSRYRVDYASYILPVTAGSYYGIPLKSIELYSGNENGIRGKQIVLDAPEKDVKKMLARKKVWFRKAKAYRAVVSGTARETAVTCHYPD
jgi:hypothetical protein